MRLAFDLNHDQLEEHCVEQDDHHEEGDVAQQRQDVAAHFALAEDVGQLAQGKLHGGALILLPTSSPPKAFFEEL